MIKALAGSAIAVVLLLWGTLVLGQTQITQPQYALELVPLPTTLLGIQDGPAINDRGYVAFDDNFSLYVWQCVVGLLPCPQAGVLAARPSNSLFLGGVDIDNELFPSITEVIRTYSGPSNEFSVDSLRKYSSAGGITLLPIPPEESCHPQIGMPSIDNRGQVVVPITGFTPCNGPNVASIRVLQFYGLTTTASLPVNELGNVQIAKQTGEVAVLQNVTLGDLIVYQPGLTSPRTVASSADYSTIGYPLGMSEDGAAVAFWGAPIGADSGAIYLSIKANPADFKIPLVQQGAGGVGFVDSFLLPVFSRVGSPVSIGQNVTVRYQWVSVFFTSSVQLPPQAAPVRGLYSRDALFEIRTQGGQDRVILRALSPIAPVMRDGDTIAGIPLQYVAITSGAASLRAGNLSSTADDVEVPLIAFRAVKVESPFAFILPVRALRRCNSTLPVTTYFQYPYTVPPDDYMGHTHDLISAKGCFLTSATNILNGLAGTNITPRAANVFLRSQPTLQTYNQTALLDGSAIRALGTHLGTNVQFWSLGGSLPAALPAFDTNVNGEPYSPVVDFFACNGQPVVVKIGNCLQSTNQCVVNGHVKGHFVVGKDKTLYTPPSSTVASGTVAINDPGYNITRQSIDIARTITNSQQQVLARNNKIYGVRVIAAGGGNGQVMPIAGAGANSFQINTHSPIEVVVTDPAGRRFGLDPATGTAYMDLDNAWSYDDSFSDPDAQAEMSDSKGIVIGSPEDVYGTQSGIGQGVLDGTYTLQVIGTDSGPFTITLVTSDATGFAKYRVIRGTTTPGARELMQVSRSSSSSGAPFTVSRALVPTRSPGDVDLNGIVDINDVQYIVNAIGSHADGPDDPLDLDGDGMITVLDARRAASLCSFPRCASQ